MENENILVKRIKEERLNKNLTQQQLADLINEQNLLSNKVSRNSITRYENGTRIPNYEILGAIGVIFNVDIDYLVGRSDKKHFGLIDNQLLVFVKSITKIIDEDNEYTTDKLWSILSNLEELIECSAEHNFLDILDNMLLNILQIVKSSAHENNMDWITNLDKNITQNFISVRHESYKNFMGEYIPKIINKVELNGIYKLNDTEIELLKKFYFDSNIDDIPCSIRDIFLKENR